MKENKKKLKRKERGITLIALVITIIVLLILAGISIAMLTGENGILTQAQTAKQETEKASVIEQAKADVLGVQSENGGKIDKDDFVKILRNYFEGVPEASELPEDLTTLTLITKEEYGSYPIKISEIYNGELVAVAKTVKDLKLGDRVIYKDKNNKDIECVVLWDASSEYGVQIISKDNVDTIILGEDYNFEVSKKDYNNALKILYDKAQEYLNPTYASSARCVGSNPEDPDWDATETDEVEYYTKSEGEEGYCSYLKDYYGLFKNEDSQHNADWAQMEEIDGIKIASDYYWLASRELVVYDFSPVSTSFCVRIVDTSGDLGRTNLDDVYEAGYTLSHSRTMGFRPVFNLKAGIKITEGDGVNTPYKLEV